jgi:hypothetical protein
MPAGLKVVAIVVGRYGEFREDAIQQTGDRKV